LTFLLSLSACSTLLPRRMPVIPGRAKLFISHVLRTSSISLGRAPWRTPSPMAKFLARLLQLQRTLSPSSIQVSAQSSHHPHTSFRIPSPLQCMCSNSLLTCICVILYRR
jgi:hypothetical protein